MPGWFTVPASSWARDRKAIPAPWPEVLAVADLRFWDDPIACGGEARPSLRTLGALWGWGKNRVDALVNDEQRWRDNGGTATGQRRDKRGTVDKASTKAIARSRDSDGTEAGQRRDNDGTPFRDPPSPSHTPNTQDETGEGSGEGCNAPAALPGVDPSEQEAPCPAPDTAPRMAAGAPDGDATSRRSAEPPSAPWSAPSATGSVSAKPTPTPRSGRSPGKPPTGGPGTSDDIPSTGGRIEVPSTPSAPRGAGSCAGGASGAPLALPLPSASGDQSSLPKARGKGPRGKQAHPHQRALTDAWGRAWAKAYPGVRYPWQLQGPDRARVAGWAEALGLDDGVDLAEGVARLEEGATRYLEAVELGRAWPPGPASTQGFTAKIAEWLAPAEAQPRARGEWRGEAPKVEAPALALVPPPREEEPLDPENVIDPRQPWNQRNWRSVQAKFPGMTRAGMDSCVCDIHWRAKLWKREAERVARLAAMDAEQAAQAAEGGR